MLYSVSLVKVVGKKTLWVEAEDENEAMGYVGDLVRDDKFVKSIATDGEEYCEVFSSEKKVSDGQCFTKAIVEEILSTGEKKE